MSVCVFVLCMGVGLTACGGGNGGGGGSLEVVKTIQASLEANVVNFNITYKDVTKTSDDKYDVKYAGAVTFKGGYTTPAHTYVTVKIFDAGNNELYTFDDDLTGSPEYSAENFTIGFSQSTVSYEKPILSVQPVKITFHLHD